MQSNKLILLSSLLALALCAAPYGCSGKYESSQAPSGTQSQGSSGKTSYGDGQVYPGPGSEGSFAHGDGTGFSEGTFGAGDGTAFRDGIYSEGTFGTGDGSRGDGFFHAPEGCNCADGRFSGDGTG
ncbi:MAG TPA: hypothetical protein VNG33_16770, partial [Polyangiaceae bacterium]|nr:hypothetical protein [Polyangiaceae bacterium]